MVLFAYVGELGSGKTLSMTFMLWKNWLFRRKKVYANYHLFKIPYILLTDVKHFQELKEGFVGVDELWRIADSRMSRSTLNSFIADILGRSRKRHLNYCFLPDEKVVCNPSISQISQIPVGSKIFTHTGNFQNVSKTYENDYEGSIFTIKSKKLRYDTTLTSEHLIYVAIPIIEFNIPKNRVRKRWSEEDNKQLVLNKIFGRNLNYKLSGRTKYSCVNRLRRLLRYTKIKFKYSWVRAREIDKEYFLLPYPIISNTIDKEYIDLADYMERIKDGYKTRYEIFGDSVMDKTSKTTAKRMIKIDRDFCYLVGIYLSDGRVTDRGIDIAFGKNQMKEAERVRDMFKRIFGLNVKISNKKNFILLRVFSKAVMDLFLNLFGKGKNKKLPDWFLYLPKEKQMGFIEGYADGDGYRSRRGYVSIITSVQNISFQIMQILLRNKIIPESYRVKGTYNPDKFYHIIKYSIKKKSRIGMIDGKYAIFPISQIKERFYRGKVYNLEVDNDNSYVSSNMIVHNSFTAQLIDSIDRRIRKVIDFTAYPILSADEMQCKVNIFRTGYPREGSYMKTFYFKTPVVFEMYQTDEEVDMTDTISDNIKREKEGLEPIIIEPPKIIFQESADSEPIYFNTWEEADAYAEKWWIKNRNLIRAII